jgi:hypothetical protein
MTEDEGKTTECIIDIDKQTTPDRLTGLDWNEDRAYAALKKAEARGT